MKSSQVRDHIRSNVVGYLVLFLFATSGTASALEGTDTVFTDDIVNGHVRTNDIGNGQVQSLDVADESLTGADVADTSSIGGAEIDEANLDSSILQSRVQDVCAAQQAIAAIDAAGNPTCVSTGGPPSGPAGGALSGSYPDPSIAANAIDASTVLDNSLSALDIANTATLGTAEINEGNLFNDNSLTASDIATDAVGTTEVDGSLTGANVADTGGGSLTGADVLESSLAKVPDADNLDGASSSQYTNQSAYANDVPGCNPTSLTYINCVSDQITLPSVSNVLVIASGAFVGTATGDDRATCELRRDSSVISGGFSAPITVGQQGNEHVLWGDGFARNAIDTNVPAGTHTWSLHCSENEGDVKIWSSQIVVVRLSG